MPFSESFDQLPTPLLSPPSPPPPIQPSESPRSAEQPDASLPLQGRLLLISNRLPITISRADSSKTSHLGNHKEQEPYIFQLSSGGLVSGLSGLAKTIPFQWYGWTGLEIPLGDIEYVQKRLKKEFNAVPVFLKEKLAYGYYNGFSNSVLWPLFHYHSFDTFDCENLNVSDDRDGIEMEELDKGSTESSWWTAYSRVNRCFAQTIAADVQDNDMVWVNDYHLMLLPRMLREEINKIDSAGTKRNIKIGFFLHTPFPSSEVYQALPVREKLLRGVLRCDLIGFHTYDYVRHFLSCCFKLLDLWTTPTSIEYENRTIKIGNFPIGIDTDKFSQGMLKPAVQNRIASLERHFQANGISAVLLSIDRLDYIKGIPQKLQALESFFKLYPEWARKMVFVQIAVPSRQDVEKYQQLGRHVNELVGSINSRFGSVETCPIHILHRSIPFEELLALYSIADACIVSSTRDGMNLVSYEYIAAQTHRHRQRDVHSQGPGSLILSEFAGAAELLKGSLIVNPWNTAQLAETIYTAITMDLHQRRENFAKMEKHVHTCTSARWGKEFVSALASCSSSSPSSLTLDTTSTDKDKPQERKKWNAAEGFDGAVQTHWL